jgi:hypothetical protein
MNSDHKVVFICPSFISYEIYLGTQPFDIQVPRIANAYGAFDVYEWNNRRVRLKAPHRRKGRHDPRTIIVRAW